MATMTVKERKDREVKVKELLAEGMSLGEMSRALGVSQQSVHKFLLLRGWQTPEMAARHAPLPNTG